MPIYAYRCEHCGHAQDVLQKMSDKPLTVCPACGESTFRKQVTAAGFQLKGSGWYVTDFRNPAANAPKKDDKKESGDKATDAAAPASESPAPAKADVAAPAAPAPAPKPASSSSTE